jgi:hypothetical protein
MAKKYQVGYRDNAGKVKYCPLSNEENMEYASLKSDEERTRFIQRKIQIIEIKKGFL